MKKSEFKKIVREYLNEAYEFSGFKSLYIKVEDWNEYGYIAYCVMIVNTSIVHKFKVFSDSDKTKINDIKTEVYFLD